MNKEKEEAIDFLIESIPFTGSVVPLEITGEGIKIFFRKLSLMWHPDKNRINPDDLFPEDKYGINQYLSDGRLINNSFKFFYEKDNKTEPSAEIIREYQTRKKKFDEEKSKIDERQKKLNIHYGFIEELDEKELKKLWKEGLKKIKKTPKSSSSEEKKAKTENDDKGKKDETCFSFQRIIKNLRERIHHSKSITELSQIWTEIDWDYKILNFSPEQKRKFEIEIIGRWNMQLIYLSHHILKCWKEEEIPQGFSQEDWIKEKASLKKYYKFIEENLKKGQYARLRKDWEVRAEECREMFEFIVAREQKQKEPQTEKPRNDSFPQTTSKKDKTGKKEEATTRQTDRKEEDDFIAFSDEVFNSFLKIIGEPRKKGDLLKIGELNRKIEEKISKIGRITSTRILLNITWLKAFAYKDSLWIIWSFVSYWKLGELEPNPEEKEILKKLYSRIPNLIKEFEESKGNNWDLIRKLRLEILVNINSKEKLEEERRSIIKNLRTIQEDLQGLLAKEKTQPSSSHFESKSNLHSRNSALNVQTEPTRTGAVSPSHSYAEEKEQKNPVIYPSELTIDKKMRNRKIQEEKFEIEAIKEEIKKFKTHKMTEQQKEETLDEQLRSNKNNLFSNKEEKNSSRGEEKGYYSFSTQTQQQDLANKVSAIFLILLVSSVVFWILAKIWKSTFRSK